MNGGTCTLYFASHNGGTAVNIRYSILQLVGARYIEHEKDLSSFAGEILQEKGVIVSVPLSEFGLTETSTLVYPKIDTASIIIAFVLWFVFSIVYFSLGIALFAKNPHDIILVFSIVLGWITALSEKFLLK